MKAITKTISVKNFTDLNIDKKIFLDESFQRGTDEKSSWEDSHKKDFIDSTLLGSAVNPIVLVDIKAALDYNLQTKSSPDSVIYFQGLLDKGFEYLSIDGNNRSITYKDFRNDLFKALHKSYLYDRGSSEIKKDFDKYSTMPSVLQEKYNDTQIDLKVFTEITSAECRDVFRNLNKGVPLNHQQYRQSYPSDFAQYVRDNRRKYMVPLSKFLGNKEIQELKGDEYIAKMACYAFKGEYSKVLLDKIYFDNTTRGDLCTYLRLFKSDSNFNSVLKQVMANFETGTQHLQPNAVFDYFVTVWNYKLNNIKVEKPDEYYKLWLKQYVKEKTDIDTTHPIPGENSEYIFDDTIRKIPEHFRTWRLEYLLAKIETEAYASGLIIQQEDPDKYFTKNQKFIMWERQKGICPATQKTIPFEEVLDYTKWHGDAIIPKDKGGKHTLDNGRLICAEYNIKKSNRIEGVI